MSAHEQQEEPCRTCDGTGVVETAEQDSRVIHHEPCPQCAGPAPVPVAAAGPLLSAVVHEYGALLAHEDPWQWMPAAEPGERDYFLGARHALERVARRLGVPADDLHERAVRLLGEEAQP